MTVILAVDDIHTYYGQSHVLQGVSLSVDDGQVVALLGRNGMGKTTTVRSIMGLTPPRAGDITFRDESLVGKYPEAISKLGISMVPEHRDVFAHLTVEENLKIGGMAHGATRDDYEAIYSYFPRLAERRTQPAGQLSGGEQQMLAVGRSLLTDPDLLMLDEPTEGLAPTITETITTMIDEINDDGVSILLIEQNLRVALALADYHFIIENGQIIYEGSTADLRQHDEMIEQSLGIRKEEIV